MLDQIIFFRKHSSAESALELFNFHVNFTDVFIMVSNLGESFSTTMTANILFLFGMSSDVVIKFAKT